MKNTLVCLQESLRRCRNFSDTVELLKTQITVGIDLSDVYRAQVIMAISALDYFVHNIIRIGILEQYENVRAIVPGYTDFLGKITFPLGASTIDKRVFLEEKINQIHSWKSFQQAKKITQALNLITDVNFFWTEMSNKFSCTVEILKMNLDLKVKRRNQIAHEADINPTYGQLWTICEADSREIIDFVELFCINFFDTIKIT